MSGVLRLLMDDAPGERRAVVLRDGLPERLWIERDGEPAPLHAGRRGVGRVRRVERGLGLAFIDLGDAEAVFTPRRGERWSEGAPVEVEVLAPARRGKAATVRVLGPGEGAPRLAPPTGLAARLQALAPGAGIETGPVARDAADLAQDAVLATEHPIGGGASLSIERTRALTAVDVDLGGAAGGDPRRGASRINRMAFETTARLLRLKGLGGLVVFDLVGRGEGGGEVLAAARAAFAADAPDVAFGPVSRLGVFHLALPWRAAPVEETLCDADGGPSARTVAQAMARAIEREAAHAVRISARCAPGTAAAAEAIRPALVARLGPRFDIKPDPALGRETFEVRSA